MKCYIGIDNGVTGSIGILYNGLISFSPAPCVIEQDYTKESKQVKHIDALALYQVLLPLARSRDGVFVLLERPFKNPGVTVTKGKQPFPMFFAASISATDAYATTRTVLMLLGVPFATTDSKVWQKELLPVGVKGSNELKKASMDVGMRLFPLVADVIKKHKDADGLLLAEFARRKNL